MRITRTLFFVWKQRYTALIPPMVSGCEGPRLLRSAVGPHITIENPSDATGLATGHALDRQEATEALHRICTSSKAAMPSPEAPLEAMQKDRAMVLTRLSSLLRRHADLLAAAEALNTGLSIRDARRSVQRAAECLTKGAAHLPHPSDSARGPAAPVALCWSAANFPLQWGVELLASAFCGGASAVVWVPPLEAPLSALWLMHLMHRSGEEAPTAAVHRARGMLHILLCRPSDLGDASRFMAPSASLVGWTNGFDQMESNRIQSTGSAMIHEWDHRPSIPSVAILTECASASLWAKRISDAAFDCNGRTRHPLRLVFVPRPDALLLLRELAQCVSRRRVGHALDPEVESGPLPGAAHVSALRAATEAAVCSNAIQVMHVCGGFEPAMPAGHFWMPCVLYVNSTVRGKGEKGDGVCVVLDETWRLFEEVQRLGGGPLVMLCGYDHAEQVADIQNALSDRKRWFVRHPW